MIKYPALSCPSYHMLHDSYVHTPSYASSCIPSLVPLRVTSYDLEVGVTHFLFLLNVLLELVKLRLYLLGEVVVE